MRGGPKALCPRKDDPGPWKIWIVGVGTVVLGIGRMRVVGMRVVGMGGGGVGVVAVGVLGVGIIGMGLVGIGITKSWEWGLRG